MRSSRVAAAVLCAGMLLSVPVAAASALSVLPRTGARTVRMVAWLHGTMVKRGYAASDYLGLGAGPGHHPYMLKIRLSPRRST